MADDFDLVLQYSQTLNLSVTSRTILVEGTTDAGLFKLASDLEFKAGGTQLLGADLAIIAAGRGDLGGTRGVARELIFFRGLARACILPNGTPKYRFIGLFDNDPAGKQAVRSAGEFDRSILEWKDVFRLWPIMPRPQTRDPGAMKKAFENINAPFKTLDWEIEDYIAESFLIAFESEEPSAVRSRRSIAGRVHREFAGDGKSRLHRYISENGLREDVADVIEVLRSLRYYLGLK